MGWADWGLMGWSRQIVRGGTMGWVGYVWICVVGPWVGLDMYGSVW